MCERLSRNGAPRNPRGLARLIVLVSGAYAVFSLVVGTASAAQSQRLGIAAVTNLVLAAGKEKPLESFCMDDGLPAPKPGNELAHVVLGDGDVQVSRGTDPPVGLQKAIQDGIIALIADEQLADAVLGWRSDEPTQIVQTKGRRISEVLADIDRLLKSKPKPDVRRRLQLLRGVLDDAVGVGDGTRIRVVNKTKDRVSISSSKAAVVSESPRSSEGIVAENIVPNGDRDLIWAENAVLSAAKADSLTDFRSTDGASHLVLALHRASDRLSYVLVEGPNGLKLYRVADEAIDRTFGMPTGKEAIDAITQLTTDRIAALRSVDPSTHFVHLSFSRKSRSVRLQVGERTIGVSQEQLHAFLEGEVVPEIKAMFDALPMNDRLVVVRDALAQSIVPIDIPQLFLNPLLIQRRLKAHVGGRALFVDDKMERALENLAALPTVRSGSELTLVSDKNSFPVHDFGVVDNIETTMHKDGVNVIKDVGVTDVAKVSSVAGASILLLTGHKDPVFKKYVKALADAGVLRGKIVSLFSCYETTDEFFNSSIIRSSGARAVLFFSDEIDPSAVEEVLIQLGKKAASLPSATRIETLVNLAIDAALSNAPSDRVRAEIEGMRQNIVIQLSRREETRWHSLAAG